MFKYELRVFDRTNTTTRPDATALFDAADDAQARDRMSAYAAGLPGTQAVWLYRAPAVAGRSIASEQGYAS